MNKNECQSKMMLPLASLRGSYQNQDTNTHKQPLSNTGEL